jgi:integrase
MAQVITRTWRSGPRKARRIAWGYTLQVDGRQVRKFDARWTEDDAEKALAARLLGLTPAPAEAPGLTLGAMLDTFLAARAASKRNKSAQDDRERSKPLLAFFGKDTPVSAITTARVADYRLHRAGMKSRVGKLLSPTTINRECQVLRGAFNLAVKREEVAKAPHFAMESEAPRERWLTPAEISALLDACRVSKNAQLEDLVRVDLHTGLRLSELTGLGWEEVDLSRGVITLDGRRTKSGKPREVPINSDVYAVLARRRSAAGGLEATGRVWGGLGDVDTAFGTAVRRAKLESPDPARRVTFHTLRHTFACHFAARTGDMLRLQRILGHASIRTTEQVYTRFAPGFVAGATAALEGLGTPPISTTSAQRPSAPASAPVPVS